MQVIYQLKCGLRNTFANHVSNKSIKLDIIRFIYTKDVFYKK